MIEISYDNVMNGLNKGISMSLICPTQQEADRLYRNALDLWLVDGYSSAKNQERTINYGYRMSNGPISIRFKSLDSMRYDSWRGFRGIFLFHPCFDLKFLDNLPSVRMAQIDEMNHHNERYLEQWRA